MKYLFSTLILSLAMTAAASASAPKTRYGSQCGLTDEYGADSWKETGKTTNLWKATDREIQALPALAKQQIFLAAKISFADYDEHAPIEGTVDAVHVFRDASEGEEVYLSDFIYNGKRYTQLQFYPGGNPGGVIFEAGSKHAVATIGDSDVICL